MAVNATHPAYDKLKPDWRQMVDTHAGERAIKEAGQVYLSATSGMHADGMATNQPGLRAYISYKMRARFPDAVDTAVRALIGIMHTKPPTIDLPSVMEPLLERATNLGESLEVLLQRINMAQLITGRIGLLLDVPTGQDVGTLPYISTYEARTILNWDDGLSTDHLAFRSLNLVVLDETGVERDKDFNWTSKDKFRVLVLGDATDNEGTAQSVPYRVGVFTGDNATFDEDKLITPSLGGRTLDFLPFTFINAADVVANPDAPPLLGLSALVLGVYRGEADYRQALFMQGQDTLVVSGISDDDASFRTGAGATIILPVEGDAKFIGVNSSGISEMRQAIENDKAEASQRSGDMVDSTARAKESGDALRIRVGARTATLNQVAMAGAFGLQTCLRQMAMWVGADPEQVVVKPNMDFVNDVLGGEELVKLATAKSMGAPLSNRSIHHQMQEKGLTQMTLDEELSAIEEEEPLGGDKLDIEQAERDAREADKNSGDEDNQDGDEGV